MPLPPPRYPTRRSIPPKCSKSTVIILVQHPPLIGSIIGASGPISIDGGDTFLMLDIYDNISKHKTINDIPIGELSWEYWCSKFFPQHPITLAVHQASWSTTHGYRVVSSTSICRQPHSMQMQTIPKRQNTTSPRISVNYFVNRRQARMHPTYCCQYMGHYQPVQANPTLWASTTSQPSICQRPLPLATYQHPHRRMHVTTSPGTSKHDEGHPKQNGRHHNSTTCQWRRHLHKHPSPKLQTTAGFAQQLTNLWRPCYPMVHKDLLVQGHTATDNTGFEKRHLCSVRSW